MPARLVAVTFDAHDPHVPARFWAGILGRTAVDEPGGVLVPGDATQAGLRFVRSPARKAGLNRLHLHLTSAGPGDQERTVANALRLGASHLDVGQRPEDGHVVLADPEGNEFCVIEPGNAYLAGCGLLGEVACDGSREVGLFWSAALGWPLVWDEGGETAVQSPAGGTKVAWGGPPLAPGEGRRQRFDLASDGDLDAEAERLVSLGATRAGDALADPDGHPFGLTAG